MSKVIRSKKLRNEFASKSTGEYYPFKGVGIDAFETVLESYGLHFGAFNMPEDSGQVMAPVVDCDDREVGAAYITWYRMPSGNYEIIGYLA